MKKSQLKELVRERVLTRLKEMVEAGDGEESSDAVSRDAKRLGLTHKGWGRYADRTGKVTHLSIDGRLVPAGEYDPRNAPRQVQAPEPQPDPGENGPWMEPRPRPRPTRAPGTLPPATFAQAQNPNLQKKPAPAPLTKTAPTKPGSLWKIDTNSPDAPEHGIFYGAINQHGIQRIFRPDEMESAKRWTKDRTTNKPLPGMNKVDYKPSQAPSSAPSPATTDTQQDLAFNDPEAEYAFNSANETYGGDFEWNPATGNSPGTTHPIMVLRSTDIHRKPVAAIMKLPTGEYRTFSYNAPEPRSGKSRVITPDLEKAIEFVNNLENMPYYDEDHPNPERFSEEDPRKGEGIILLTSLLKEEEPPQQERKQGDVWQTPKGNWAGMKGPNDIQYFDGRNDPNARQHAEMYAKGQHYPPGHANYRQYNRGVRLTRANDPHADTTLEPPKPQPFTNNPHDPDGMKYFNQMMQNTKNPPVDFSDVTGYKTYSSGRGYNDATLRFKPGTDPNTAVQKVSQFYGITPDSYSEVQLLGTDKDGSVSVKVIAPDSSD